MVPEGWSQAALSAVAELEMGQAPPSAEVNDTGDGLPFIQGNAEFGFRSPSPVKFCPTPRKRANEGDILMSVRAPVGALNIAHRELGIGRGLAAIKASAVDRGFLWHALSEGVAKLASRAQGSTFAAVNKRDLAQMSLLVPSLPEQRKIAAILGSVDALIERTQAVIDQVEVVKKGLMQELLTRGLPGRHTRFKQTEIGEIPESWEVVRLGDVASVKGGKRMPKGRPFAEHPTPFPYIRVSDFSDGSVATKDLQFVLPEDQAKIARYTISKEDLYISIAGTLGVVGVVPEELDGAQLTENAAKIVIKQPAALSRLYLREAMGADGMLKQIQKAKGVGGGVPKLALFRIEDLRFGAPTMKEQEDVAEIAVKLRARILRERRLLEGLKALKGALSDTLLSGEVRVQTDESEVAA